MSIDVEKVIESFEKRKIEYFNDLKSLVRIPSVSFDGFDPAFVRRSAEATAELMKKHGLENVQILDQAGSHPYAYGEWLKNPGAPTLLLYAHHDVQPPGRENIWTSPPFEPTQRDGRLFGRGAADDKAGIMVHLAAISSYLGTTRQLPVNVKLIVEGEEEIGSTHLEDFLKSHRDLLQADVMVLTDTTNFDVGFPALTVALRGLVAVTVEMRALKGSVHSGMWGGPVPDPVVALSKVISKLTDDNGDLAIPELLEKVKPLSKDHQKMLADLPYNEALFKHQSGMLDSVKISGTPNQNVYAKMWHLPSVSVNAIEASSRKMAGNIINDVVWAKIGLRIVPDMDPNETLEILMNFIRKNTPWGIDVKITPESTGPAWSTKTDDPAFERAMVALEKGYKKQPVMMGCGGSIPFVGPFSEALGGAPALLIGVEDPMSNAHGENESLYIEDWEKCCKSSIYLYDELSKLPKTPKK